MEALRGWRTVMFNVIMAAAMCVTLLTGTATEDDVIVLKQGVEHIIEGVIAVWTVGNLWLRAVTDTPIFQGRKNAPRR